MTPPPGEPAHPTPTEILRARGLRATTARIAIIEALRAAEHPTVEALHRAVAPLGIALTTVYRTLETLEHAGVVGAIHVPETGRTYHVGTHPPHAHLLCESCGRLEDLEGVPPAADWAVPEGFSVAHVQVTVFGTCAACRDAPPA